MHVVKARLAKMSQHSNSKQLWLDHWWGNTWLYWLVVLFKNELEATNSYIIIDYNGLNLVNTEAAGFGSTDLIPQKTTHHKLKWGRLFHKEYCIIVLNFPLCFELTLATSCRMSKEFRSGVWSTLLQINITLSCFTIQFYWYFSLWSGNKVQCLYCITVKK